MNDALLLLALWGAVAAQAVVTAGSMTGRMAFAWLVICNAGIGGGVVIYSIVQWYSHLFEGIRWYLSDQWLPAYGLAVLLLCAAYMRGPKPPTWLHRAVFHLHTALLLAAAVFFSTFELDRLF